LLGQYWTVGHTIVVSTVPIQYSNTHGNHPVPDRYPIRDIPPMHLPLTLICSSHHQLILISDGVPTYLPFLTLYLST
jgi:hypothetical protein